MIGYYVEFRRDPGVCWTRETLVGSLVAEGAIVHPESPGSDFVLPGAVGILSLLADLECESGRWARIRVPTGAPTRETWEVLVTFVARLGGRIYDAGLDRYIGLDNLDDAVGAHRELYRRVVGLFGSIRGSGEEAE